MGMEFRVDLDNLSTSLYGIFTPNEIKLNHRIAVQCNARIGNPCRHRPARNCVSGLFLRSPIKANAGLVQEMGAESYLATLLSVLRAGRSSK
jgi:hypothetical protein